MPFSRLEVPTFWVVRTNCRVWQRKSGFVSLLLNSAQLHGISKLSAVHLENVEWQRSEVWVCWNRKYVRRYSFTWFPAYVKICIQLSSVSIVHEVACNKRVCKMCAVWHYVCIWTFILMYRNDACETVCILYKYPQCVCVCVFFNPVLLMPVLPGACIICLKVRS